jgi:hypothetical protein
VCGLFAGPGGGGIQCLAGLRPECFARPDAGVWAASLRLERREALAGSENVAQLFARLLRFRFGSMQSFNRTNILPGKRERVQYHPVQRLSVTWKVITAPSVPIDEYCPFL